MIEITEDHLTPNAETRCVLSAPTCHTDLVINGFSIKETILGVLLGDIHKHLANKLAQEITDAFAVKLHLMQGDE